MIDVLANDTDPDGDTLTVESYDDAGITDGILVAAGGGRFTYTPDANWSGTQAFSYTVRDDRAPPPQAPSRSLSCPSMILRSRPTRVRHAAQHDAHRARARCARERW